MNCPKCHRKTVIKDTRSERSSRTYLEKHTEGNVVYRKRSCKQCDIDFNTFEEIDLSTLSPELQKMVLEESV